MFLMLIISAMEFGAVAPSECECDFMTGDFCDMHNDEHINVKCNISKCADANKLTTAITVVNEHYGTHYKI